MRVGIANISGILALILVAAISGSALAEVQEIEARQLQGFIKKNPGTQLIDVREDWERGRAKIPKSQYIPMGDITTAMDKLDMEKPVITYCKTGRRSRHAAEVLAKIGFKEVYTLKGGIEVYSLEVDPSIPRY
jgi:rhodanese-related sulfurtransferase